MTRADLEADLLKTLQRPMRLVGLDGTTQNGTNDDLNAPMRDALLTVGLATLDALTVADVDLDGLKDYALARVRSLVKITVLRDVLLKFGDAEQYNTFGLDLPALEREEKRIRWLLNSEEQQLARIESFGTALDSFEGGALHNRGFVPNAFPGCPPWPDPNCG